MLRTLLLLSLAAGTLGVTSARAQDPKAIVAAAVAAELHANRTDDTAFIYRDHDVTEDHDTVSLVVETPAGGLKRKLEDHGHPLTREQREADDAAIRNLLGNKALQEKQKRDSVHDDQQAENMLKLLPVAFLWTLSSEKGDLVTLSFKPDPAYEPSDMQNRVLSSMAGQIVVSRPQQRIRTIRGALVNDVKFGFGIFGRLKQGGSFQVERREVAPRHWQVTETHVHIGGHALFFKSIGDQEDDSKSDFRISTAKTLEQANDYLSRDRKEP